MNKNITGPLSGVRIIDITTIILGPYATQILGDMGADVIKVESPGLGDLMRHMGSGRNPGMSGIFLNVNRNKRSIALDLKNPKAKGIVRQLIRNADVFFHNMRPQAIARLGFDYQAVKSEKHDIIYCGAYGYSAAGPYAAKPAYDDLIQGASGLAALATEAGGSPSYTPTVISDKVVGLMASQAILAALFYHRKTGEGQEIEVPMFEAIASFLLTEHISGRAFEPPVSKAGNPRLLSKHRRPAQAKDGYICILPYTDENWQAFFKISGHNILGKNQLFATYTERMKNIDELYKIMCEIIAEKTVKEWSELCEEEQIPWSTVNTLDDLFEDEHLNAVNFFQHSTHPSEGSTVLPELPLHYSATPTSIHRHAPRHGEHGEEILTEMGYTREEIDELVESDALTIANH